MKKNIFAFKIKIVYGVVFTSIMYTLRFIQYTEIIFVILELR
jgi:hypothetical protein